MSQPPTWRAALVTALALGATAMHAADDPRRSGFEYMAPATQALQRDDGANPGMLMVAEGEDQWRRRAGSTDKACADCHGDARQTMRGVAARYPAWDESTRQPIDLGGRIRQCRERQQRAAPFAPESEALLGLQAYLALQSRGLPMAPPADARLDAARALGRQLYTTRIGQLDLACAQCHDERAGLRLGGSTIPQARTIGYPTYRLEWQAVGSLQRRFRNCMTGVRAEPYAFGAPELVALELWLAQRDRGMLMEAPAVRP